MFQIIFNQTKLHMKLHPATSNSSNNHIMLEKCKFQSINQSYEFAPENPKSLLLHQTNLNLTISICISYHSVIKKKNFTIGPQQFAQQKPLKRIKIQVEKRSVGSNHSITSSNALKENKRIRKYSSFERSEIRDGARRQTAW